MGAKDTSDNAGKSTTKKTRQYGGFSDEFAMNVATLL
jgi:hypothetical protein